MKVFYLGCILLLLSACDIFDKEEPIPAFLKIDSASLQTDLLIEGANTADIRDVRVSANGQYVGTFDLPASIPILDEGPSSLVVLAGIRNNGLSSDRQVYPFYKQRVYDVNLIPGIENPITADSAVTFQYFEAGLNFEIEDFEGVGISFTPSASSNAMYEPISNPEENVRSGSTSLEIILTPDNDHFEVFTSFGLSNLPKGNKMYLEIDFKGDHSLVIGVLALGPTSGKIFALGLVPRANWTKIYVDLTNEISSQIQANNFEIYFESKLEAGESEKHLYIDNIKFIYP